MTAIYFLPFPIKDTYPFAACKRKFCTHRCRQNPSHHYHQKNLSPVSFYRPRFIAFFNLLAPYTLSMTTRYPSLGHCICLSRFSKCRMFSSFVFFSLEALFTSLGSVIRSVSCYVLYLFLTCSARTVSRTIQPTTDYLHNQASLGYIMLIYKTLEFSVQ